MAKIGFFGIFFQTVKSIWLIFCQNVKLIKTHQNTGSKNFSGPPGPHWVDPKNPKNGQNRVFQDFLQKFIDDLANFLSEGKTNWEKSENGSKKIFGSADAAPGGPEKSEKWQKSGFSGFSSKRL